MTLAFVRDRNKFDKAIMGLALVGFGFMSYLSVLHYQTGGDSVCNFGAGFNCQIVNQSLYSEILGIPVAILGLVYFAAIFAVTAMRTKWAPEIIQLFTIASLVFSFYLSFIEAKMLATFCLFCELAKITMLLIFLVSYRGTRAAGINIPTGYYGVALLGGVAMTLFAAVLHF